MLREDNLPGVHIILVELQKHWSEKRKLLKCKEKKPTYMQVKNQIVQLDSTGDQLSAWINQLQQGVKFWTTFKLGNWPMLGTSVLLSVHPNTPLWTCHLVKCTSMVTSTLYVPTLLQILFATNFCKLKLFSGSLS